MLMHCTMDDLIALHDGTGSAAARRHVVECAGCRAELERVEQRVARLRALPVLRPPRDRWATVRHSVVVERRRRRWLVTSWATVALAASVVLAVGVRSLGDRRQAEADAGQLTALVEESRQLDAVLGNIDPRGRVVTGRAASAIIELEDRLADIDERLAAHGPATRPSEGVMNLWRQRVQVQGALVGVHATRASYIGM